ncbi:hypothetical protein B0H10DRAFT_2242599 [Mycena sp. CBHHK59/15]|nr:hypothetical protein B0H10DRAFT_2242599 [Mycena sp. CBHHK59/15]
MPRDFTPRKAVRNTVTSLSNRVQTVQGSRSGSTIRASLSQTKIEKARREQERREKARLENLSQQERRAHDAMRDLPDPYPDDDWEDDIVHGRAEAQISHAGEALPEDPERADSDLFQSLRENQLGLWGRRHHRRYHDNRPRHNRTQLQVDGFAGQLEWMADAYMELALKIDGILGLAASYPPAEGVEVQQRIPVDVIDIFSCSQQDLCIVDGDVRVASACVRRGWIPVSPWIPNTVITIRALEVFRVARLRCPRLGIQAFVRALCDIHGLAPRDWLGAQFTVAFDVYLAICAIVDGRVQVALGRDTPDWRLKNACPCCLYKVEGEVPLEIPLLATFDGNNSLSRFHRRERVVVDDEGTTRPGASRERFDNRVAPGDYYLTRDEVDLWGKEGEEDLLKSFAPATEGGGEEEEDAGCAERWQNMKEEVTSCAYGMYDETGFFPALCRHSFILKVCDMVKSGELAKYPLAIASHLMNVLGEVAVAYDVGCKLGKQIKVHPALKDLARDTGFRALVGAFHGHGHARLCGIDNLMIYVKGVGLEAGEGCEILFSKSNALAPTTRYATRYHRQLAITTYLKHIDAFDTYHGLSLLLCNKYRRALRIRATHDVLRKSMRELGVLSRNEFDQWREKERAHLQTLSKEPEGETMEMEYFQKLVNLQDSEQHMQDILGVDAGFNAADGAAGYAGDARATRRIETQRRHALEVQAKALDVVQDLEVRLEIETRWVPGSEKWVAVAAMVRKRRYQRALDKLQGLIIARMFELAKCNMSGTGYKLRKHIAKALQARSRAVRNAITSYNQVAAAMTPPKPTLSWEEVVEYAFLADFDLLREGREDIRGEAWAQQAERAAMDQHYKLLRAEEELVCLNVEIHRLVTYMRDEDAFLRREEACLREEGRATLAQQVALYRMERGRSNSLHNDRLVKLSKEPGFTANLQPGTSVCRERHTPVVRDRDEEMPVPPPPPPPPLQDEAPAPEDEDEEDSSDDDDGEASEAFLNIVRIVADNDGGVGA